MHIYIYSILHHSTLCHIRYIIIIIITIIVIDIIMSLPASGQRHPRRGLRGAAVPRARQPINK